MNVFYRSAVPFEGSHLWELRQLVGHQLVLTPASIVVAATGTTARAVGFIEAGEVRGSVFIGDVDDLLFDGDEALLAGVELRFISGGTTLTAVSDDDGIFRFVALPGTWTLAPAPDQPLLAPYAVPSPSVLTLGPGEFIAFDLALVPL